MKRLLVLIIALVTMAHMSLAQLNANPPIGTWESSESLLFASADMKVNYRRVRLVVTADQFRVTEWVRGSRELPGVGLNFEMHIRDEWACKYLWEGNTMRVTRIVQNPKTKIEKYSLGGDPNILKVLKSQGVTAETYRPAMEQSFNLGSKNFDVTAIVVRNRKPDEFILSYEGVTNITMKRVAASESKTSETPKASTTTEPKDNKAAATPTADNKNIAPSEPASVVPDSAAVAQNKPADVQDKPAVVKDNKPAAKPAEEKKVTQEEKSWYVEAWETFLSWF